MTSYLLLEDIFTQLNALRGAQAVLHWDSAAMMPKGGAHTRAEQLATLEGICHDMLTSGKVTEFLDTAEDNASTLSAWQSANLKHMRHQWIHANAINKKLVEAFSKAGSESEMMWREAKEKNEYASFAPYLQQVIDLSREIAQIKSEILHCTPYEALLDLYDPGVTEQDIDPLFARLEAFLPSFIEEVVEKQKTQEPVDFSDKVFPVDQQERLGRQLMQQFGFDFTHGRLDKSMHPFCGGVPKDVRMTTRYDPDNVMTGLMGILHETGHALYEMGLPEEWLVQPVGHAASMSIHESQSLLIEMQVCRSHAFMQYLAPLIAKTFDITECNPDQLYATYTKVEPAAIRVDADEVTYPLHIILRYELEQCLISGEIDANDIPALWNERMHTLLGVEIKDDREGCLQDIHWSDGSFGYFPTYTLGAIYASQFYHTVSNAIPEINQQIAQGNFTSLVEWLHSHIHGLGAQYTSNELVKQVTGTPLDVELFITHLQTRYLS